MLLGAPSLEIRSVTASVAARSRDKVAHRWHPIEMVDHVYRCPGGLRGGSFMDYPIRLIVQFRIVKAAKSRDTLARAESWILRVLKYER